MLTNQIKFYLTAGVVSKSPREVPVGPSLLFILLY